MMSSSQTDDPKTPLKDISTNGTTNYEIKESEKEEMIDVGEPKLSIELQTVSNKNTMDNNNDTTLVVNNSPMASSPMASSPIPANTPHSISMPDIPIPSNPTSFNDDTGYLKVQTKISTDGIGINAPSSFLMSQRNSTSYTKPLNDGMINQGTLRVNTNSTMNNPHPQDTMRSVTGLDSMYYQPTFRHAPTIRDELLLPPKDKEPDDINFEIAITYLRDALKIRPPQRRIQDLLGATFKPLSAYKLMKSFFWSHFIYTLIWCNMLLTVWEPPQDTIPGNKDWNKNRVTILVIYQLIFIFFYSLDICLKFYSHDKREIGQWTYIISLVLFYDFIISIITFFFYDIQEIENLYRSSRIIRPFFLFYKSRDLKKLARSILRGIPSLFEVGALIVLFLLLFSFAAYYLFNESEWLGVNPSFETFQESVYSLMVLQTTANFPDVMMPSYDKSEWTAVFFFIYNVLGIYFLMALVLAVIYNNYSDHILRDVERIKLVRERAINATFKVLTWHQNHPDKHLIDNHRTKNSKNKHSHKKLPKSKKRKQKYKKVIYLSTFKRIMKRMRKDLYSTFNNNAEAVDEQIQWMYLAMANATEPDYDDGIDKKQFSQIANYIELEITKDIAKAKRLSVLKKTQKFQSMSMY